MKKDSYTVLSRFNYKNIKDDYFEKDKIYLFLLESKTNRIIFIQFENCFGKHCQNIDINECRIGHIFYQIKEPIFVLTRPQTSNLADCILHAARFRKELHNRIGSIY